MATPEQVYAQDAAIVSELAERVLGRRPIQVERMAAGLGRRRFLRLSFEEGRPAHLVARIEDDGALPAPSSDPPPPAWLPEPALEPIRSFLEKAGLPVPRSYGHFPDRGIDLLEDVGSRTLASAQGSDQQRLYREACDHIVRLQALSAAPAEVPAFGRRFDHALIASKAWKWLHWTLPLLGGRPATGAERQDTERLFARLGGLVLDAPMRLSHRDFKAENLHWPAQPRPGSPSELVLIDVQGAFLAPPEYDLVCLLDDLQLGLAPELVEACLEATRPRLPDRPDPEVFRLRFDALAVMRLCKDVSHVIHAARVRGDARRWHEVPRGLSLLEEALQRLEGPFPEARALSSVIHALTCSLGKTDSPAGK